MSKSLKKFVNRIRNIDRDEGKRWVDLNSISKGLWSDLEEEKLIHVYHSDLQNEDLPLYWTWTSKGKKELKKEEIDLTGLDPQFWITGEEISSDIPSSLQALANTLRKSINS